MIHQTDWLMFYTPHVLSIYDAYMTLTVSYTLTDTFRVFTWARSEAKPPPMMTPPGVISAKLLGYLFIMFWQMWRHSLRVGLGSYFLISSTRIQIIWHHLQGAGLLLLEMADCNSSAFISSFFPLGLQMFLAIYWISLVIALPCAKLKVMMLAKSLMGWKVGWWRGTKQWTGGWRQTWMSWGIWQYLEIKCDCSRFWSTWKENILSHYFHNMCYISLQINIRNIRDCESQWQNLEQLQYNNRNCLWKDRL